MSEERIIIIRSSLKDTTNHTSTTNNYWYNIGGILPLNIKNIKVKVIKLMFPQNGILFNANFFQVLIDFGSGGSNHYSLYNNQLLLMEVVNCSNYCSTYDTKIYYTNG